MKRIIGGEGRGGRELFCHCRRQRRGWWREITSNLRRGVCAHLQIGKWISLLCCNKIIMITKKKSNTVFPSKTCFLCLSKLSGGMSGMLWLIISLRAEAQTKWAEKTKRAKGAIVDYYVPLTHIYSVGRQHAGCHEGSPFFISYGKNLKVSQPFDRLKITVLRRGKLLKGWVLQPPLLSAVRRCKHSCTDNIVWWKTEH